MAGEAYRAVFLRVHPTGKMVLSLTTDADGNEPRYAQLVADELGVPPLDVKVVPADTDRFGVGHGYNTSPSPGAAAAIARATAKIRDKAQLLAGTTQPVAVTLAIDDAGALSATAVVTQSAWGMKPYSALFGALKVKDEVVLVLEGHL